MEDAELYKPPGLVEDAERWFQLSLRYTLVLRRWNPVFRPWRVSQVPGAPLPRIPQWPRIMHMTLAEQ